MPPSFLAVDTRGFSDGGAARVGVVAGGLFFNQIGGTVPGGYDTSQTAPYAPKRAVVRFRGQLYVIGMTSTANTGSVWVYDEGGANAWTTGVSAKGGRGVPSFSTSAGGGFSGLLVVNTEDQDYLVFYTSTSAAVPRYYKYDPDNGVNGTWASFDGTAGAPASQSFFLYLYKGLVYGFSKVETTATGFTTFDPVGDTVSKLTGPGGTLGHYPCAFVLEDRLFVVHARAGSGAGTDVASELVLGAWTDLAPTHELKSGTTAANITAVPIGENSCLLFGGGGPGPSAASNGLKCYHATLSSPTGTLSLTDVTTTVIPTALRPASAVGNPDDYRVYGFVDNDTTPGTPTYWLAFHNDGVGTTGSTTLFQVTDHLTELVNVGSPATDSDFAFPADEWGGGERYNGIDGSTRLVTASPRGFSQGTTGLTVNLSVHGDAAVIAHGTVSGGPYTVGETITGSVSSATGVLIGDGAAEGLYLRSVSGTFVAGETLTGGTSSATSVSDTVLTHGLVTSGPFQIGETITGGTSGATGVVTVLGDAGELIKMDTISGTFVISEVITGGTSGASATTTSAPLGVTGGVADKTVRARYFLGAAAKGLSIPTTGFCTMVAGSGMRGTVTKGTGPSSSDELSNVVADGAVGGDVVASFEWDFLTDSVPLFLITNVQFEVDRT